MESLKSKEEHTKRQQISFDKVISKSKKRFLIEESKSFDPQRYEIIVMCQLQDNLPTWKISSIKSIPFNIDDHKRVTIWDKHFTKVPEYLPVESANSFLIKSNP